MERPKVALDEFEEWFANKLKELGAEMSAKVLSSGALGQLKAGTCFMRRADFSLQGTNVRIVIVMGEEND